MSIIPKKPARQYVVPANVLTPEQSSLLTSFEAKFNISKIVLKNLIPKFHSEMDLGLQGLGGNLLMVPSYVTARPTGNETGHYLALDFGGTNCRICLIELQGSQKVELNYDIFKFSNEQLKEDGSILFSTIADFIHQFLQKHIQDGTIQAVHKPLNLGFTFSFPVNMTSLNEGKLVRWTKGFENPGVVGKEVVSLLQSALDLKKVPITVNAVVNDTVGTLITSSYSNPTTQIGLILGTGTNAAYYEKMENIPKLKGKYSAFKEMAINMEWGAFDNDKKVLPLNEYDEIIDQNTWNPNQQIFEKTVSGFYLGEIFRIIIKDLYSKKQLLKGFQLPKAFDIHGGIDTAILSKMLTDETKQLDIVHKILKEDHPEQIIPYNELILIQKLAELIGYRAAQFAATACSAVLLKRPELLKNKVIIGVDGSVFEHFPNFPEWMYSTCDQLLGIDNCNNVQFAITKDGSGVGAALISMIAEYTSKL
ncbi:hypothetical protein K502DRAFT_299953 [Neoconidiobolus thromboides FSU 785]|nr:hypothetical protein K502DRAFT_299953 [Neoconidiobolus thromboides FSU 785]